MMGLAERGENIAAAKGVLKPLQFQITYKTLPDTDFS